MKKLFLSAIFAISAIIATMTVASADNGTCESYLDKIGQVVPSTAVWEYNSSTGTVTISGTGGALMTDECDFMQSPGFGKVTNLVFEEGITCIDGFYYGFENITSVTIPTTVTAIGDHYSMNFSPDWNTKLTYVYYAGTEAEWNKVSSKFPSIIKNANIRFNDGHGIPSNPTIQAPADPFYDTTATSTTFHVPAEIGTYKAEGITVYVFDSNGKLKGSTTVQNPQGVSPLDVEVTCPLHVGDFIRTYKWTKNFGIGTPGIN